MQIGWDNPFVRRRALNVFTPEQFGNVTGNDPAVDMPLVNAAIAAASERRGTVRLRNTYAYTAAVNRLNLGSYVNTSYGFQINTSGVKVDGGGRLKIAGKPTFPTTFVSFLVGNGLYDYEETGHTFPGHDELLANGNWIEDVILQDISFDNSALSDADLAAMTTSVIGSCVMFSGVRGAEISNISIDRGYGSNAAFHFNALTRDLVAHDIHVEVCQRNITWLDGLFGSELYNWTNTTILSDVGGGLILTANTDYHQNTENVHVHDCVFNDANNPAAVGGLGHLIEDNIFNTRATAPSHTGMIIGAGANERGLYPASNITIINNEFSRPSVAANGFGVEMDGATYLGQIAGIDHITFQHNIVGANRKFLRSLHIKKYVTYCDLTLNDLYNTILDDGSPTSHDNLIAPNTFH